MKKVLCCSAATVLGGVAQWQSPAASGPGLAIHSPGIRNQLIDARFGKFGAEFRHGMPSRSLPLIIEQAPSGTRCFALSLVDYDAIGAVGMVWVHWLLTNFTCRELPENASYEWRDRLIQGVNSWGAPILGDKALAVTDASCYGGMTPPDRPHRYDLTVYALKEELPLSTGFGWHRLLTEMGPHLLGAATVSGVYPA